MGSADTALLIGANDVTNLASKTEKASPIYNMLMLDVEKARQVFVAQRSMASGYAGVDNPLFYMDQTMTLLSDAKKMCDGIVKAMGD